MRMPCGCPGTMNCDGPGSCGSSTPPKCWPWSKMPTTSPDDFRMSNGWIFVAKNHRIDLYAEPYVQLYMYIYNYMYTYIYLYIWYIFIGYGFLDLNGISWWLNMIWLWLTCKDQTNNDGETVMGTSYGDLAGWIGDWQTWWCNHAILCNCKQQKLVI